METEQENKTSRPFNWKLVLITFIVVGGFVAYWYLSDNGARESDVAFCRYEKEVESPLPRHECAIIKMVSKNLDQVDWMKIKNANASTICSIYSDKIPSCYGKKFYYSEYNLNDFCAEENCNVKGDVCAAYYITYANETDPLIESFEDIVFDEKNINSSEELTKKVLQCGQKK